MKRAVILLGMVGVLLSMAMVGVAAQSSCKFVLGFAMIQSLIPDRVGQCLEDEWHNGINGDGIQTTSGGLMAWRKADNHTAFTDGYQTWVNGECGLQQRLNTQRFTWEPEIGGPVNCVAKPTSFAPPVPHPVAGQEQCLACHQTGAGGATIPPANHAGRTNEMCQICHKPIAGAFVKAQPAVGIPHLIAGREQCTACHLSGAGGAPVMPATHAGRTNDMCQICHQPLVGVAAKVPHDLAGNEDCLSCHQTGALGAKIPPATHASRTNDTCQVCHTQGPITVQLRGPLAPHTLQGVSDCLSCHQTGALGAKIPGPSHAGRTNDMCQNCHSQGPITVNFTASLIPHTLQGIGDCLSCHTTGALGAKKAPASHVGRASGTCQNCHKPGPITVNITAAAIPHTTAGTDCLACHTRGITGAKNVPASHAGRANNTCVSCHAATSTSLVAQGKRIAHAVAGRETCLVCHLTGVGEASRIPSSHNTWPNGICLACHRS